MASSTFRPRSVLDATQHPRLRIGPPADETEGDLAALFASRYGLVPDEWQALVLDDWLSTSGGKWASLTCGLSVPRQNGKNAVIEIRELYGAVGLGEHVLHTAHEVKTAQKHFRRLLHFFGTRPNDPAAKFPELNALVEQVRRVNGQEAILLNNGGSIELVARSKNSARGFTIDLLVLDEAQEMDDDALEALVPTTAAAPSGNPQWIYTGTPPGPSASGAVFTRVRDDALAEDPYRLCWHEWSPEDGFDGHDRAVWRETNPALASGRLQIEVIEGERSRFSDGGFDRERLGKWPDKASANRLISHAQWNAISTDVPPSAGVRSFGVAFSRDGLKQSCAGAVRHADGIHVELVGAYSGPTDEGVRPLAKWLAARWRDTAMIAISGQAGAAPLTQALIDEGVPQLFIHVLSGAEYLESGPMLHEAVKARTITHPVAPEGDELEESVAISDKKLRGTSGGWAWASTTPDGDETPMEAISIVHWAAKTTKRVPGGTGRGRNAGRSRGPSGRRGAVTR